MPTTNTQRHRLVDRELARMIEPLASYVAAADRPRDTLLSALTALLEEVQGTHQATLMHFVSRRVDSLGLAV